MVCRQSKFGRVFDKSLCDSWVEFDIVWSCCFKHWTATLMFWEIFRRHFLCFVARRYAFRKCNVVRHAVRSTTRTLMRGTTLQHLKKGIQMLHVSETDPRRSLTKYLSWPGFFGRRTRNGSEDEQLSRLSQSRECDFCAWRLRSWRLNRAMELAAGPRWFCSATPSYTSLSYVPAGLRWHRVSHTTFK